jgi:hypothetical protein
MPSTFCLLPAACLPAACVLLPFAFYQLPFSCGIYFIALPLLPSAFCLLPAACRLLPATCRPAACRPASFFLLHFTF